MTARVFNLEATQSRGLAIRSNAIEFSSPHFCVVANHRHSQPRDLVDGTRQSGQTRRVLHHRYPQHLARTQWRNRQFQRTCAALQWRAGV